MAGIDDLLAASNDRWSRAMKKAQGVEDIGMGPAVKSYYTRYLPAGALALLAAGTGAGNLMIGAAPANWAAYLSVGLIFATAGILIGGLVYNSKKVGPAVRLTTVDVLFLLADEERKYINRQIAGKAPLDHDHLPVVRAGAVQLRKSLATQLVFLPAYAFLFAAQAANQAGRDTLLFWVMALAAVAAILALGLLARQFRRTGRFLAGTSGG